MKSSKKLKSNESAPLDPLYIIFEEQLYHFNDPDLDRKTFITKVVSEYLSFLRKRQLSVPPEMERYIVEELSLTVSQMLVKKIYGCFSIEEYRQKAPLEVKKKSRSRFKRLKQVSRLK